MKAYVVPQAHEIIIEARKVEANINTIMFSRAENISALMVVSRFNQFS